MVQFAQFVPTVLEDKKDRWYDKNTLIVTNKKLTYQGTSFTKIIESTKSFLLSVSCFMENSNLHWPYGDVSEKQVLVNQL